jgi:threonylcarbamoyladenosine tRNA methylthiotransferase MtaB
LGDLVAGILEGVPELPRLRLSSVDGIEIDPLLEELIVSEPRLQPFLHLSLQSGDDLILKRMKRRHSRAQAIELCHRLKAARPELAFGADIIAGFPTESDEAFERSCTLIEACGLSFVHVFPFSPRPGTPAARMPQLSRPLIKERAAHLRGLAERARAQRLAALEGVELDILVEEAGRGRTPCFTEVNVPETPDWAPGRLARACLGPSGDGRRASIITDKALEEMAA